MMINENTFIVNAKTAFFENIFLNLFSLKILFILWHPPY